MNSVENVPVKDTNTKESTSFYKMYKVIMHNDPKTTMDFVSAILIKYFEKQPKDAMTLMMEVHKTGSGLAGVYPFEGAEFRVEQAHSLAKTAGYPFSLSIEPE